MTAHTSVQYADVNTLLLGFLLGPAHVPMMSTNGSVPPIYVPPGYVSQVNSKSLLMVLQKREISQEKRRRFPTEQCFKKVLNGKCDGGRSYLSSRFLATLRLLPLLWTWCIVS